VKRRFRLVAQVPMALDYDGECNYTTMNLLLRSGWKAVN
jgi:hypothetical protein